MRHYIITLFMAAISTAASAQIKESPDTVINEEYAKRLIITESKTGNEITVTVPEEDGMREMTAVTVYPENAKVSSSQSLVNRLLKGYGISSGEKGSWEVVTDGVCIGLNRACGQGSGNRLQWGKSFEISWTSIIGVKYSFRKSAISLGLGITWRNYKVTTSDRCLTAGDNKGIEWGKYPEGSNARFSRLKIFTLQMPLFFRGRIPKSALRYRLGPVFCFNTYGSLKTVFDDSDGNRRETFTKDIDQRKFTVDFMGAISFKHEIGLYVRYSPMKVMGTSSAVNFRPLTIGITAGF